MTEIRLRIDITNGVVAGSPGTNSQITCEFCYLQLRFICELIALGCLVAHGDIKETNSRKFTSAYSAEQLMKMLAELHPDFFPVPAIFVRSLDGPSHFEPVKAQSLTKEELIKLNQECGQNLHRGNLKKLLTENKPVTGIFPIINTWLSKIVRLLDSHHLVTKDQNNVIAAGLSSLSNPSSPWVSWATVNT